MNIYVGFLPTEFNDQLLREKFEAFGEVTSAKVIMDRETGLSKGFGFVEMKNTSDGQNAIEGLKDWVKSDGRTVKVNEAQERAPSGSGNRDRRPQNNRFDNRSDNRGFGGGRKW
jgi:RNA recognition motif-containing protein